MLTVGTAVCVILPPLMTGDCPPEADPVDYEQTLSAPTTIVAIQWITPEGEISDDPQENYQYLLDAEEPFPDIAMRPELVREV